MRFSTCALLACALVLAFTGSASAADRGPAKFMTPTVKAKLKTNGADGVRIAAEALNTECPGIQSPGVAAAGCIVAPAGCTANFIFTAAPRSTSAPRGTASTVWARP